MSFPEVERVLGKAGRAETSTDPAPLSMMETVIQLKPQVPVAQGAAPGMTAGREWTTAAWRAHHAGPHFDRRLVNEMDDALRIPGVSNAWTMPIKNRIDMLTTGVRTPVGIKIYGADLAQIERIGTAIEGVLPHVRGTRSVFAERVGGGYFLDFDLKRDQLARYGLSVDDAQIVVMNAIGGDNVSTAVEGRERYPINVRYYRDSRSDLGRLGRALVSGHGRQAADPAGRDRHPQARQRPLHAAQRKRHAERLRVRGRGRPRCGQLRGRGQARGARQVFNCPPGYTPRLERAI